MTSPSGRFVIVFNGEIYNHLELRERLSARTDALRGQLRAWSGTSDTETLLAAFDSWGIQRTLQGAVGMFALAVWDLHEKALYLARDRFGEKPLYYGWTNGNFVFGSELKALRAYPGFNNSISRTALAEYLTFTAVPAPLSIYEGVFKLEPGCLLRLEGGTTLAVPEAAPEPGSSVGGLSISRWWSLGELVEEGARNQITDEIEAVDLLEQQLTETVNQQCLADVPLGAFLSGGIDSSAIAALLRKTRSRVSTFTVAFEDAGFDESAHARRVAAHLGTEHHELVLTSAATLSIIPQLATIYDEPFADSSQIPTYLLCRAARSHVTVALSGDAGDELFGGYNRYIWAFSLWRTAKGLPGPLRDTVAKVLASAPPPVWDFLLRYAPLTRPGEKLHKLARVIRGSTSFSDVYLKLLSEWNGAPPLARTIVAAPPPMASGRMQPSWVLKDTRAQMMYQDSIGYLPNDILCKVDRAAMASSLETRTPFLDHRVAALAWRLPMHMKVRGRTGKWALRQVLDRHVPRELIERPKAGFAVPLGTWLRGPLREWAEDLLDENRMRAEGYLDPRPIGVAWKRHLSGREDLSSKLWTVLMFQSWLKEQC